jgi:nucleotidyltransferase/DNA polymerase involved in DNA repair
MFIAEAKKRCPQLVIVPYEFDKYQIISEQVRGGGRHVNRPIIDTMAQKGKFCLSVKWF